MDVNQKDKWINIQNVMCYMLRAICDVWIMDTGLHKDAYSNFPFAVNTTLSMLNYSISQDRRCINDELQFKFNNFILLYNNNEHKKKKNGTNVMTKFQIEY